jgi:hypothetical protein
LWGAKLHIPSMAAKAKKGERLARSAEHRIPRGQGAAKHVLKAADFERTVTYRGIKIEPMKAGKRSPLARAIRDDLRTKSEQPRGKSG